MTANLYALGAIALWGTLAALGLALRSVPPFLLLGTALTIAGLASLPSARAWHVKASTLALGVYGIFGFHLFLLTALRHAPAVEANLINYLWPLLIVLLTPAFFREAGLTWRHVAGGLMGFVGASMIVAWGGLDMRYEYVFGYACACASALIWATYSLGTRKVAPFPSAAVGLFCMLSGVLALGCHMLFEPSHVLSARQWGFLFALGLGPMGAAFFLWDRALKLGDPRTIGALSYLTPLLSTMLLAACGYGVLSQEIILAMALIVGGAALGSRPSKPATD